ncbi:nicotinate-nicotinamide nucleotide adenylyltransferase [Rhodothermaceae bacterium RA]|nr:nicotinate-nicotinamide nucleotide adenylyltransferase [Rhodothermaceae bacterium RA]
MQVGLYGGSFNPPHLAHLIIAEHVREQFGLDAVWWVPSFQPPHKERGALVAPVHRLAMTRLATAGHPAFRVSDLEIRRGGVSYTVETLRVLQEAHPNVAFSLVIGGDSLRDFDTWHRPDEIVERVPLLVYRRPGVETGVLDPAVAARVQFTRAPLIEISGTDIRRRCREGRSIRYLVPEPVRHYIEEHGLYRRSP